MADSDEPTPLTDSVTGCFKVARFSEFNNRIKHNKNHVLIDFFIKNLKKCHHVANFKFVHLSTPIIAVKNK